MISVDIRGGLGNQLFQLMATLAYSIRTGIPFVFPENKFTYEGANRPTYWTTMFRNILPNVSSDSHRMIDSKKIQEYTPYQQSDQWYEPIPILHGDVLLQGYYQDYRYFSDVYDQVLNRTGILDIRREVLSKYVTNYPNMIRISMHFRRGDYKDKQCYHPVLGLTYYINALSWMMTYIQCETDKRIQIVCIYEMEDKPEVLDMVRRLRDLTDRWVGICIEYVTEEYLHLDDWEQMLVMSGCDHHIIANSTFSWWAAYLNPSLVKLVCYPNNWYGHQLHYIYTEGLSVPGWHCIQATNPWEIVCECGYY